VSIGLAVLFGAVVGALLGLVGAGGGIVAVPALVYGLGLPVRIAVPVSLIMTALAAATAALPRLRTAVSWPTAALTVLGAVPTTFVGAAVNAALPPEVVLTVFAIVMVVAGLRLLLQRRPDSEPADIGSLTARRVLTTIGVGLLVGFLTGLLGVGGGFVIIPALAVLLKLPFPTAVGTSLVITAVNSCVGFSAHLGAVPDIPWPTALAFILAALVASLIGGRIAGRLPAGLLQRGFAILVLVVAAFTAAQAIAGRR
jgi:hypothetical protein